MESGTPDSPINGSFASFAKVWKNSGRGRGGACHNLFTKLHPFSSGALRIIVGVPAGVVTIPATLASVTMAVDGKKRPKSKRHERTTTYDHPGTWDPGGSCRVVVCVCRLSVCLGIKHLQMGSLQSNAVG